MEMEIKKRKKLMEMEKRLTEMAMEMVKKLRLKRRLEQN